MMIKINEDKLRKIRGGFTITSSVINSINNLIKILIDAGNRMGSAVRRIGSDSICPLE